MEDDELKAILREAFGDSSSDSDGEASPERRELVQFNHSNSEIGRPQSIFGDNSIWEPISEINGLSICRDFLSADQQRSLLSALEKEGYLGEASQNQAMRFGDLPPWALELSRIIRENVLLSDNSKESCLFPSKLIGREPLFNQLIVNIYQPGEGICAHVDLMRFEDGIAIVSLESSCVMHFSPVEDEVVGKCQEANHKCVTSAKIPVLLNPGSVILMWGEARYQWKHEINRKPGFQNWQEQEIDQKRRTSVTLRRLCGTE